MLDTKTVSETGLPLRTPWLTIPNILSASRIVAAPVLVMLAVGGHPTAFLVVFVLSVLSDGADGNLARYLSQESELGAHLDAAGDIATWIATPIALSYLVPSLFFPELPLFIAGAVALFVSGAASFFRYGKVAVYHTWSSKAVSGLLSVGTVALLVVDWPLPFRLGAIMMIVMGIEELLITLTLDRCRSNVPSLWHARRQRSG